MLNGVKPTSFASSNTVSNAFNGAVTIEASTGNKQQFEVTFAGLGKEACVALMTADWGSGSGSGLVSVGDATNPQGTTAAGSLPVTLTKAATACNTAGDANSVKWVYY
jgi:hypothetical protein